MAVLIGDKNKSAMYHLATEEYLLRHYDLKEDILYIWFGTKAFIFGRNQNPFIEIHPKYLADPSIMKLRRLSGGGTIYEDQGTINFSIITNNYKDKINDYQYFLNPLIQYLNSLGIKADFHPKTHVYINHQKISGNAQAFINHRLMHHGTILYRTDLSIIEEALVDYSTQAKGHQVLSNKQKVTNLMKLTKIEPLAFIDQLISQYCQQLNIHEQPILNLDYKKIQQIVEEKYQSWDWNFGATPKFEIDVLFHQEPLTLVVEKGLIKDVSLKQYHSLIGQKFNSFHMI